jgi:hypothetical protein
MALLSTQKINSVGLKPALTPASAGGDQLSNGPQKMLVIENTSGAQRTVTINVDKSETSKAKFGIIEKKDRVVVVEDGETKFIGPLSYAFEDINSRISFTYDNETGLAVASVLLPIKGGPVLPAILRQNGQPILRQSTFPILTQ